MEIQVIEGRIATTRVPAVIVGCCEGEPLSGDIKEIDQALDGAVSGLVRQKEVKGKLNEITLLYSLGKLPAGRVLVLGLGKPDDLTSNKVAGAFAEACRFLRQKGADEIAAGLLGSGVNGITPELSAQALAEGALLGLYTFRAHITRQEDEFRQINKITVVAGAGQQSLVRSVIDRVGIIVEAANLTRDLVNEPANYKTPTTMAEKAGELGRKFGLEVTVLEREQMRELGMGGLLGVAQGSQQPPKFIIMRYRGRSGSDLDLALVGKGITFDSGGISIKPSEKMDEMKGDMSGGAAVMSAVSVIAGLKAPINVIALIPATENMPGGRALKPGDILTAMNGKTMEILSTDAEGRLVLADALSYAVKQGAKKIVDVATLTGACVVALGEICTGVFGNDQPLIDRVLAAGKEVGEPAWQMPMFDEYRDQIKSTIADIKNTGGRYAGAITAAKFLQEFVNNTPWVHLDIAGTNMTDKDRGYLVKGATGVPVRTLVNLALALAK